MASFNNTNILNFTPVINNFADTVVSKLKDDVYQEILQIKSKNNDTINFYLDSESDNEEEIEIIINYFDVKEKIHESNV